MDDHDAGAPGKPPEAEDAGDERDRGPDREYIWEGRPGEDFGPIAPPTTGPPARERRRVATDAEAGSEPERLTPGAQPTPVDGAGRPPRGAAPPPPPRRRWRPILTAIGALVVLGVLATAVLVVISRQASESATVQEASPGALTASPAQAEASPLPAATPAPASPAPDASPTPLALSSATAVPSPLPTRSPAATTRPSPVVVPAFPGLGTPPALRFPTSTPARLGTPLATRTPPAVPTARPSSFLNRIWSDQVLHRVGDQASICAAVATGASAQVTVIGPDRSVRTLGELQPPAERVCYTMQLDQPGLYVLSLIVKDASGSEIDRQSGALSASR